MSVVKPLVSLITLLFGTSAYAAGDYPLASCKGWDGTITEKSGVNSQNAMIKGIVTKADIQEYCERDPGGMTKKYGGKLTEEQCVAQVQGEVRRVELASVANCSAGTLVFRDGSRPPRAIRFPLGPNADTPCASGAPPLIAQFKTLCPVSRTQTWRPIAN